MTNLLLESAELDGARKLLLKLESYFAMSITPSVKFRCKQKRDDGSDQYEYFPLPAKYRKIAGEGMMRFLLADKDNLRRYLYEDCPLYSHYETDKKGKIIKCNISTKP